MTTIKTNPLFIKIVEELKEDISRFVEEEDDIESWEDTCLDFPSDNLEKLLGQIPEDEDWYDLICDEISKIGDKLRKEINED
jgi:hypothetical protein